MSDWIQTFTGLQFFVNDMHPEQINIQDIAHALSLTCRYGGHCKYMYSVAEHSVLVSRHVNPELKLPALLHDASEAYLGDIPRPIKKALPDYIRLERQLEEIIARRFSLPYPLPAEIKEADNRILIDEHLQLMGTPPSSWSFPNSEPLGIKVRLWSPTQAEQEFLATFEELTCHL